MDGGGPAAVVPVGMDQIASVNSEDAIVPGARVERGDPPGCFRFGGDSVMVFSQDPAFEMTAAKDGHLQMGEIYGKVSG